MEFLCARGELELPLRQKLLPQLPHHSEEQEVLKPEVFFTEAKAFRSCPGPHRSLADAENGAGRNCDSSGSEAGAVFLLVWSVGGESLVLREGGGLGFEAWLLHFRLGMASLHQTIPDTSLTV